MWGSSVRSTSSVTANCWARNARRSALAVGPGQQEQCRQLVGDRAAEGDAAALRGEPSDDLPGPAHPPDAEPAPEQLGQRPHDQQAFGVGHPLQPRQRVGPEPAELRLRLVPRPAGHCRRRPGRTCPTPRRGQPAARHELGVRPGDRAPGHAEAAGDFVYVARGTLHSIFNTGWRQLRVIAVYTPGGAEPALRELPDFTAPTPGVQPVRERAR
ncbi:hypothetical protein ABT404_41540 [Streptomyces hyaluromycini]|uniref:Cupin 2 conserved barrel domain-containing protein n=1 Tax=Streptomyces hyaluromycini TaxID=1377993 RepID=A0ABV1XA19_9ACTN